MKYLLLAGLIILVLAAGIVWYNKKIATNPMPVAAKPTPSTSSSLAFPSPSPSPSEITLTTPQPNQLVKSPLEISGKAPGTWFFEAQAPVKLVDEKGKAIANGQITAQGDWQTTDLVPFSGQLVFDKPTTSTGQLVLEKDNPSGRSEISQKVTISVRFE